MSNPHRLIYKSPWPHLNFDQELRVGGVEQQYGATPRERDLAAAIAAMPDEWFEDFLVNLRELSPNRAIAVAYAAERAALVADVAGGDCDPGFGVDPEDSARLLELRQTIDALGWNTTEEEEAGDYVGRLKQVREEIAAADAVHARNLKLEKQVRSQRTELRRFNREMRARSQGAEAQLNNTFKRWPQCRPTVAQLSDLRAVFPQWASADDDTLRQQISKLGSALGLKPR